MPQSTGPEAPRRGPRNRQALLEAAAQVFAEKGYDAPLYEVARRAGVGQGSLYRHFRGREAIVLALYSQYLDQLEEQARTTREDADAFFRLLGTVVEQVVGSLGYADALSRLPHEEVAPFLSRVVDLFTDPMRRAQEAGLLRRSLEPADILLVARMFYGVVRGAPPAERPAHIDRALTVLGLHPPGR